MANQYTSSFNHIAQNKFGKSAVELLKKYAEEKVTYKDAAKMTGVTTGTIRKWCTRYRIYLWNKASSKRKTPTDDFSLIATKDIFKKEEINIENALSRQWLNAHSFF